MKLFIHGVPNTSDMWTALIEALGLGPEAYRAPTLPCFDGRWHRGFAATKEAYLDWVIAELDALAQAHGPVDLVGHDWGAPLIALAAQRRPEFVRTWVITNAVPEPSFEWHALARKWQTPVLGEAMMALGTTASFRKALVQVGLPKPLAAREAPRIDRHMKRAILKLYRSARTPSDWEADFSQVAARGLAIWGAGDRFVPVKYAERFCERWSIPLIVEKGVGHWACCKRPEAFAAHLRAHWDR